MYTRIALGKSSAMDVVGGESSGSSGQLLLLYPMLFALQGLQVRVAVGPDVLWAEGGGYRSAFGLCLAPSNCQTEHLRAWLALPCLSIFPAPPLLPAVADRGADVWVQLLFFPLPRGLPGACARALLPAPDAAPACAWLTGSLLLPAARLRNPLLLLPAPL